MKNVLFITHHYLHGNGGGCFASRAYINAVAEIAEKVTLLVPMKVGMEPEHINENVDVRLCHDGRSKYLRGLDILRGHIHRYYDRVESTLMEGGYDTVIFDNSMCSFSQIDVAHEFGCKVIVIHHNCQYEYAKDNVRSFLDRLSLRWIKRCESDSVLMADLGLALTENDVRRLQNDYAGDKVCKIKYIGTFEYCRKALLDVSGRKPVDKTLRFLITGSLSSKQTYESLKSWIDKYYPALLEVAPDSILTIAGKDPSESLAELCARNSINLVPSPVSMDPLLLESDYYICPVSMGGGIKLRIMDGLKAGLPVITHNVSLRGYEEFEGECVFGYSDVPSFKNSLSRMLETRCTPEDIQHRYTGRFSFESGVSRMRLILEKY